MTSTEVGSKVILESFGVIDLLVKVLYPHTLMHLHGTCHDTWVESHM